MVAHTCNPSIWQEDHEFKACLGYVVPCCFKTITKKKGGGGKGGVRRRDEKWGEERRKDRT